jgi:DNA ligase (NAD+)
MAKFLAGNFPTLEELSQATGKDLEKINGIGPEKAKSISNFLQEKNNQKIIRKLKDLGVKYPRGAARAKPASQKYSDQTFVFTGALKTMSRQEAESKVESLGGRASSSVSQKTDFVVVGKDPGSKSDKAKILGVKILTEDEFLKMLREGAR